MIEFETRITRLSVGPKDAFLFSETMTHVEIVDEAAGEFVTIRQFNDYSKEQTIGINDVQEWVAIRHAVDTIFKGCRSDCG